MPRNEFGRGWGRSSTPKPMGFAAGLARKPKPEDPYGNMPQADDGFIFMARDNDDNSAERTSSNMNPHTEFQIWDTNRRDRSDSLAQGYTEMRQPYQRENNNDRSKDWHWAERTDKEYDPKARSHLEDHTLDVDSKVRAKFVDPRFVMRAAAPLSGFDKRNKSVLGIGGRAGVIKNMIGDEEVSTVVQKIDDRAEFRDRDGNYIDGINRGKMPKRLEEAWRQRLEDRDQEMVAATAIQREWDALTEEEKEERKATAARNKALAAETMESSTIEGDMPDCYLRKSEHRKMPSNISNRSPVGSPEGRRDQSKSWPFHVRSSPTEDDSQGTRDSSRDNRWLIPSYSPSPVSKGSYHDRSTARETYSPQYDDFQQHDGYQPDFAPRGLKRATPDDESSPLPAKRRATPVESNKRYGQAYGPQKSSSPSARANPARRPRLPPPPPMWTPKQAAPPSGNILPSVEVEASAPRRKEPSITILEDIPRPSRALEVTEAGMEKFDNFKVLCNTKGRIVTIILKDPVHYSMAAVLDRIFSGTLQDVQFFPVQRAALIVFLFPDEAAAFLQHVHNAKSKGAHQYRRLQISASWYRGSCSKAVFPCQKFLLASAFAFDARRVLLITGIPKSISHQFLSADLQSKMRQVLVRVRLVKATKRYILDREGNQAILEFASIKDAIEVKARFEANGIPGFEHSAVRFLDDPAAARPVAESWCDCIPCVQAR